MTLVLSPRAEELLLDVKDAVKHGVEEREEHIIVDECDFTEISAAERDYLLHLLHDNKRAK